MTLKNPRHSSESKEHYTPLAIVEAAQAALGCIDLDPATCELANRTVAASRIYTAADNGYMCDWNGRVILNPPGGKCDDEGRALFQIKSQSGYVYADGSSCVKPARSAQKLWWRKLAQEHASGRVPAAVFVGFSIEILQTTQTDADGPLPLDFPMCFPKRRVAYMHDGGTGLVEGSSPPHASVIVYLPDERGAAPFERAFDGIGRVVVPMRRAA